MALNALASYRRKIWVLLTFAVVVMTFAGAIVYRAPLRSWFTDNHDRIRELKDLPLGPVKLEGVVTYVDEPGDRFWIQDDSGAIAIDQDPAISGVHPKQIVRVEAQKTHRYDPAIGLTSVELKDLRVTATRKDRDLPGAAQATVLTLPDAGENGIRVEVKGVVHSVVSDESGRMRILFGESVKEISVIAPAIKEDFSRWINAPISVVGVSETKTDRDGTPITRQIWAQNWQDIRIDVKPATPARLYSLQQFYSGPEIQNGYAIRIRGRVVARLSTNSWLLEDRWGTIACNFDVPTTLKIGADAEVTGFPQLQATWSREIDLYHAAATVLHPDQRNEENVDKKLPLLTTLASVRDLGSTEADKAFPVKITAIVTSNPLPGRKAMLVQDSTAGIYVQFSESNASLPMGEKVVVTGLTGGGTFTPEIVAAKLIRLGKSQVPAPVKLDARNAFNGRLAAQLVELEGVIHSVKTGGNREQRRYFNVYSPFGSIRVGSLLNDDSLRKLQDAKVRIHGIYIPLFNSQRQMTGVWIAQDSNDIQVLEAPDRDPFRESVLPIDRLLMFLPHQSFDHRVKVRGTATTVGSGFFYMQDDSGGLQVQGDTQNLRAGDLVEVSGYATPGAYSPVLADALVRVLKHDQNTKVRDITAEALANGEGDSRLVSIQGRLLSVVNSADSKILVIRSGGHTFDAALLDSNRSGPLLEEGSILRLTGISTVQGRLNNIDAILQPTGFRFVIRSAQDVEVLRRASWWNLKHTAVVLGLLLSTVFGTLIWISLLRKRVQRQDTALQEAMAKAQALAELANTMDKVASEEDFTARVLIRGTDEISRLGLQFNKMLLELQTRDRAKAEAESKLQYQALTDELTGLPNRRLFSDRLMQTLAGAQRDRQIIAVLYIDLDGFKLVNDSLGHGIGDALLRQVSERLGSRIRRSDTLARIGGDEFTVVLTRLHSKPDAEQVANSLLEAVSAPFLIEKHEITISASIGISIFPENSTDASELLQQADSAMYSAKRGGKNRVMYYTSELGLVVRERLSLESQLRGAIARGEIDVHYQPEFDVTTKQLVRFEALARWTHPTLGSIPPTKFIPIAEESGLIVSLGMYILERACTEAVKWQGIADRPIQVAVNVSNIQFSRETFVNEVSEVLRHSGLKPSLLQIELTESVMLSGTEPAAETMKRLGALGIGIAIDDFGTGYSCFGYLPRLPFNTLKIDRSFVKELGTRKEMKAMIQSLVTLAHNLNMQVVVEGIETVQQLDMIKLLGGNQVQGYLLGKPTADPCAQLLSAENTALATAEPVSAETALTVTR